MTVGQRRGVLPGRDGEKRYVSKIDLTTKRVEVGRLEDILISSINLDTASVTFARHELNDGDEVLVQYSADGRPQLATLHHDDRWWLQLHAPARPVAAGQTAVLYRVDDPSVVEGAAIVTVS